MFRKTSPPPAPGTFPVERVVVASEGREIAWPVLQQAFELARPSGAAVHVVTIARVWGTSLGFPNPGLNPTRQEWDQQRLIARRAVHAIEKAGFHASAQVIGTRRAGKRIVGEARAFGADAIVMGCDPHRGVLGDFMWSQEPYRVRRRAGVPVYLVPLDPGGTS
jgi:nucleotide-binding universal stress UspA family protein